MASEEPKGTKRKEPEDAFMSPFTLKRLTKELKKIPTDSRTSAERYTVELAGGEQVRLKFGVVVPLHAGGMPQVRF